jgi:uncharacterized membrane protein
MRVRSESKTVRCVLTGEMVKIERAVPIRELRASLSALVKKQKPEATDSDYVSVDALNRLRLDRIQDMLVEDRGEVTDLEKEVLDSIENKRIFARDPLDQDEVTETFGQRLADKVASFGGSWVFIIVFFALLATWIAINAGLLLSKPFDPYPFILMNLILSCLAAIQAPVIMMSQNRQEGKDRLRSEHDYQVNLKAELEIRILHEKMDRLIGHQWQQLIEIQQMQMDMIEEMHKSR